MCVRVCVGLCSSVRVFVCVCELKYSALFVHKLDIALSLDVLVVVASIYTHTHMCNISSII